MSRGRSEAHPPPKVKHDRTSNRRIILFMLASFASSAVGCHDESGPSFIDCNQKRFWRDLNGSAAPSEPPRYFDFSLNRFQTPFPEIFYLSTISRQFPVSKKVLHKNI